MFDTLPPAPRPEKRPVTDTRHGITRRDDYAWMRADNWQEMFKDPSLLDPAIRAHLEAENAYQDAALSSLADLRKALFAEMKARIKEDDSSVPMPHGPFAYGVAYVTGGEQPHHFRTARDGTARQTLLDGDQEARGKAYFRLAGTQHAPDHARLLWGYDDKGSEFYSLRVRDLASGDDLPDLIENTGGSGAWSPDSDGFFYTRLDDNHRPSKILFHRLGTPGEDDRLIHDEKDAGFFMNVSASRLDDFVFIDIHDHETSEVWLIADGNPDGEPRLVKPREKGVEYSLSEGGDVFFILTNADGAKDFKIMQAPCAAPQAENWQEVVAHEPGRLILSHIAFRDFLVWLERRDGLPRIIIRQRASGDEHAIAFDEEAYALGLQGALDFDTDVIRFSYSSMTTPAQQFDYNMRTRTRTLLKTQEVPSGHDPALYATRRIMAPARDGALVPISLLYRKQTPLDGTAPCLLYGYGAYGISIPAGFSTNILSLVDRGFVYAIAHIRGGKDKGFAWYEDGKRDNKMNTFGDFIACADHLVSQGITAHERMIAQGGSAGGMLMGAIANMAPEKFAGIIAAVPFVDVLNTMLDDTLPLTPPEWPEWGNPIRRKADYETIAAYSPYDNVAALPYPPVLALAGLTDPRVTYWEPAKWVAKMREMSTGAAPVFLKTNMDAGHAGASGRFQRLEEIAYEYAFALKLMNRAD